MKVGGCWAVHLPPFAQSFIAGPFMAHVQSTPSFLPWPGWLTGLPSLSESQHI